MDSITLITPPDRLFNKAYSFLLIYPDSEIKEQLQNIIADWNEPINVFLYENDELEHDIDWLLNNCHRVDNVILNIDQCPSKVRDLTSYIISLPKTNWLTNGTDSYYNYVSLNRIYNLDYLFALKDNRNNNKESQSEN
tara:strand:- start:60 stop:473 length:414 start_codon:yes stop_codon:yes gene_type:complete